MASLIVTIISIVIVGIATAMGIYYGGQAFQNSMGQSYANTLLNQSQQIMATDTQYMLDHGYSDFNSFGPDTPAIAGYTSGRVGILSLDVIGVTFGTAPLKNLSSTSLRHQTCPTNTTNVSATSPTYLNSYPVTIFRSNCTINNVNVIGYWMASAPTNGCNGGGTVDFSLASNINHPLVQMCLKINATLGLPAGLSYAPSGLPYDNGGARGTCYFGGPEYDSTLTNMNYCYIETTGYFGANKALSFSYAR